MMSPTDSITSADLKNQILAALADHRERTVLEIAWDVWEDGLEIPRPWWWKRFRGRVRGQLRRLHASGYIRRCERGEEGHWYFIPTDDEKEVLKG